MERGQAAEWAGFSSFAESCGEGIEEGEGGRWEGGGEGGGVSDCAAVSVRWSDKLRYLSVMWNQSGRVTCVNSADRHLLRTATASGWELLL